MVESNFLAYLVACNDNMIQKQLESFIYTVKLTKLNANSPRVSDTRHFPCKEQKLETLDMEEYIDQFASTAQTESCQISHIASSLTTVCEISFPTPRSMYASEMTIASV